MWCLGRYLTEDAPRLEDCAEIDGTGSPTQVPNTPTVSESDPDWGSG